MSPPPPNSRPDACACARCDYVLWVKKEYKNAVLTWASELPGRSAICQNVIVFFYFFPFLETLRASVCEEAGVFFQRVKLSRSFSSSVITRAQKSWDTKYDQQDFNICDSHLCCYCCSFPWYSPDASEIRTCWWYHPSTHPGSFFISICTHIRPSKYVAPEEQRLKGVLKNFDNWN